MAMIRAGLKQGVFIFAVIAIVLPLVIIGGGFLAYYKQETTAEINDDNLHIAGIIRDGVSNSLIAPRRTLNVVAGLAVHPEYAPHIDDLMAQMVSSYGFFESILVLDGNGIVQHLGTASKIGLKRHEYLGIDLSEAEHIATARRLKKQTWSDTYISPLSGEPTLSLTVPFKNGLVVGNFSLAELTTVVERQLPQSHDRIYLVNSKGRVIAHPQKALVLQQVNVSNLPVVRAGLDGREGVYEYDIDGAEIIGAVVIIPETNWLVIVERDKDEVFRAYRNMRLVFIIVFVSAILLVAIFTGYVNTRIVKPVVEISMTTKNVAAGRFSPVPQYSGRYRELEELSGNFTEMVAALQDREQELQKSNEETRESEQRYRSLFESAGDAIFLMQGERFVDCNPKTLEIFGCSREQILGTTPVRFSPPEQADGQMSQEKALEKIGAALAGEPQFFEWKHITYDGTQFDTEVSLNRIELTSGVHLQAIVRDVSERKSAEEAIKSSEEKLRLILDNSPDAIYILGFEGHALYVNAATSLISGYSHEELMRMPFMTFVHPEDLSALLLRRSDRLAGKQAISNYTFRFLDRSGAVHWVENRVIVLPWEGKPATLNYLWDVTEKKKSEDELRESEARFRGLIEKAPVAIRISRGGRTVYCNRKYLDLYGFQSVDEIMGQPIFSQWAPDSREMVKERSQQRARGVAVPSEYEGTGQRKDGSRFPVHVVVETVELPDGLAYMAFLSDITERKRAEEERERLIADIQGALGAVSRSQKEWQDTFDSITDMISIHDKDYNVIKANKAFAANFGLTPGEVINRKCFDLMHHGASSPIAGCPHKRTMQDGVSIIEEVYDETTNKTFSVSTFPYLSPNGDIIGSIHVARDITEEKTREMQMIMTERLASLGQMASGIAHEINNPLESVMICAEMLLMRVAKDSYDHAQFEKYLKIIDEEVLRCRDITSNMLSFSRPTTSTRSDIDVHLLLDKAVDLVGYQGRLKNVTVTKKYGERFLVSGNEGELRQVLLVLLINALDAMENKGAITLETGREVASAWLRISDTGPGIAPEDLQRIFNPFFSTKTEKGGTGLGLSIAHRIVTNHKGSLTVVSEQGHGAAFTVTLPR